MLVSLLLECLTMILGVAMHIKWDGFILPLPAFQCFSRLQETLNVFFSCWLKVCKQILKLWHFISGNFSCITLVWSSLDVMADITLALFPVWTGLWCVLLFQFVAKKSKMINTASEIIEQIWMFFESFVLFHNTECYYQKVPIFIE